MEIATLAGGCFWCTEAIFRRLKGVEKVIPGYTGGSKDNPTYEEVGSGSTGHAEAIQITFDPKVISYNQLLEVFFDLHDPTTPDQQGYDIGTQYRSAIFYHSDGQEKTARDLIKKIDGSKKFKRPVVTEVIPFTEFYPAEKYHQNYYEDNRNQPYCRIIIDPKIQKLYKDFKDKLK